MENASVLKEKMGDESYSKLQGLGNQNVIDFVAKYVEHCNPSSVFVSDGSDADLDYIREAAVSNGEEIMLSSKGHTIHWDNYNDQARDKKNTRILVEPGVKLSDNINTIDRQEGLTEVHNIMKDIMEGREMYVVFGCLAPNNSEFSIPGLQLSDSAYVAHNEIILFRNGYDEFKKLNGSCEFFSFVHSQGELDERNTCKNLDKRRIYIDIAGDTVYSANNQYGGNSLGFKKHAMRLAINKANKDGNWLCEHMFVMGVHGTSGRVTYFTGAYPSACGKTSTAMLPGETIIGDDIAYFRNIDGEFRAANVERGMFGIIGGVNDKGDPVIYNALTSEGEVIFSNVLKTEKGLTRWNDDGREDPTEGLNHSGEWASGKKDDNDKEIPASHKNARYTIPIAGLSNRDPMADDPAGVTVGGVVYGGRDSDTSVPVEQAFDWTHGILTKAAILESEQTFAVLKGEGKRVFNPMSNIDFLSIPLADYINDNLNFGANVSKAPLVFSSNYFLRKDGNIKGNFLNGIQDKRVWFKWMELRVHNEVDAIKTPTGFIPKYDDLKRLFKGVLDKEYTQEEYDEQFTIRTPQLLAKIERMTEVYGKVPNAPQQLFDALNQQKKRIEDAAAEHGEYIKPEQLAE